MDGLITTADGSATSVNSLPSQPLQPLQPPPALPGGLRVHYVLKRYPRTSETFIVRELLGLEQAGVQLAVDALLPPEDAPVPAGVGDVRAAVRYLPRRPRLRDPGVSRAHARLALRRPLAWARTAWRAHRDGTWRRFVQAGLVADRARRERADHLHAHFATAAAEVARDAAALAGLTFTVTAHAKDIFHVDNVDLLAARVRGACAVVTVSAHNLEHLRGVLHGHRSVDRSVERAIEPPVVHVPNGVRVVADGEPDPGGVILCVARMVDKKGIDVLIRAFALLAPHRPAARLELIGGGEQTEDCAALAAELGVADRITFRGAVAYDEVAQAFGRAAMAVLACRVAASGDRDGMPTSLVEAAAHGLPLVATDVVGLGELVHHGDTGLLVPPEDPQALAAALACLLDDPARARRLGAAARRLVARRYHPRQSTAELLDVFTAASRSRGRASRSLGRRTR
ncbi:MAG: glycosyltransferase [Kineosporiaceae bacterium]|nr:glycosyltransferase [Kineosporiaceae bacterium]